MNNQLLCDLSMQQCFNFLKAVNWLAKKDCRKSRRANVFKGINQCDGKRFKHFRKNMDKLRTCKKLNSTVVNTTV